jgi:hypothetical protein
LQKIKEDAASMRTTVDYCPRRLPGYKRKLLRIRASPWKP